MFLICLSISWIAGIVAGLNFNLPAALILTGLSPLPLLLLNKYRKHVILLALCIASFFSASVCAQASLPQNDASSIKYYNDNDRVTIIGTVSADPDIRDSNIRLIVSASVAEIDGEVVEVSGDVLVFASRYPAYGYGDVIRITGELKTPPVFEDFDYAAYLSHESIYSTMLYPQIELIDSAQGFTPLKWIYSLRAAMSQALARVLPEPQAALAQGMLLGIRSNIPDDLKTAFSVTGTTHILAISGLNIGIVAGIMLSFGLLLFGRRHYIYIWLALGVIWVYAVLTGLEAPVVRSVIMASIFLSAELLGRQRNAITAMTFAAAVMTACDPQVILTASFQMSFTAMCGLVFVLPPLQTFGKRFINRIPGRFSLLSTATTLIYDSFAVTIAALAGVLPLIAYYFGIISIVGPLATLLVLPVLVGIILLGTLTAVSGLFSVPLSQVFGWLLWLILSYMLFIVEKFAGFPAAYIETGSFSAFFVWLYYAGLAVILWAGSRYKKRKREQNLDSEEKETAAARTAKTEKDRFSLRPMFKIIIFLAAATAILVFSAINSAPDDNLHISFLDVGQGDAILIQKENNQVLIDGGPGGQAVSLALSEKMPFWDRTIEMVILTHPHDDHLAGLVEVLKRYQVGQVLATDPGSCLPLYDEWLALIGEKNIPYTPAQAGQQMNISGVIIDVLNPPVNHFGGTGADIDNNSIVLNVSFGEISFLLTGDIGKYAEWELLQDRLIPQATVLKAGHHGSNSSSSLEFLNVCRPQIAVVPVGADNNYGHPDEEVLARLIGMVGEQNLYRTDLNGTIEFITDGKQLWLKINRW